MKLLVCTFACVLFISAISRGQEPAVPDIHRRVTDLSGTLDESDVRQLEGTLSRFESETSNQIVVLIVPSAGEGSIEDFSLRVCEKNKLGKKGKNNGVLLLIAKDDRKLRIEVGYGLEGALPDAVSDQIIRHEIVPHFRSGDYAAGIRAGISAIMAATKGEYKGEKEKGNKNTVAFPFIFLMIVIFFFLRLFFFSRRHIVGRRGYSSWPWYGGFGGGGSGGGGGFGGGGGGGFSGGGGSFGGGGASGSW